MIRPAYLILFLGEFGYELMNWHAVVRKLKARTGSKIYVGSRKGMDAFYLEADHFINLSDCPEFCASVPDGYATHEPMLDIQQAVTEFALAKLEEAGITWEKNELGRIVSSQKAIRVAKLEFGGWGRIYRDLPLPNNLFKQILPVMGASYAVEAELKYLLDLPFILCQTATRDIVSRDPGVVPKQALVRAMAKQMPVVLLEFGEPRKDTSYSRFEEVWGPNVRHIRADSFPWQSCLIHHATHLVFFTEGDFRSHTYVPPFMGRTVDVIAPAAVYQIRGSRDQLTSPIDFWNRKVFSQTGGGKIRPHISEEVCRDDRSIAQFIEELLGT